LNVNIIQFLSFIHSLIAFIGVAKILWLSMVFIHLLTREFFSPSMNRSILRVFGREEE
jgi:hypothetical protein